MTAKANFNNFLFTLFGFRKANRKVHILLIVLIHAIGWFLLFLLPLLFYPVRIDGKYFYNHELVDKALLIAFFYLNYYVLIPRFFLKKKYGFYGLLVLTLFLFYLFTGIAVRHNQIFRGGPGFHYSVEGPVSGAVRVKRLFGERDSIMTIRSQMKDSILTIRDSGPMGQALMIQESTFLGIPRGIIFMSLNNSVSSFALLLLIGGFIRLSFSFIRNQNEKKALENANLNAEVNFLKAQINPHFLFNTLNSIYSQAHNKSENTEYSILKLSDLFRYVLYDSGGDKVELSKDIQYISNYIDLQKIRLSSKVTINYTVKGPLHDYKIAPLLLITFIENAFKHGISYTNASCVNIEIHVFEETLTLLVTNPVVERNSFGPGGFGLKNVRRRLDILYPGKYHLDIHHDDAMYIVNLKLELTGD